MPGETKVGHGGVARNVAEVVARLGGTAQLLSAVGDDNAGEQLTDAARRLGVEVDLLARVRGGRTATFTALLDGTGELIGAVADMGIFEEVRPGNIEAAAGALARSDLVVCDANLQAATLEQVLARCVAASVPAWFEPVSVAKAARGRSTRPWHLVSPNWDELLALLGHPPDQLPEILGSGSSPQTALPAGVTKVLDEAAASGLAEHVLLTMGPRGALLSSADSGTTALPLGSHELDVQLLLRGIEGAPLGVPPLVLRVESLPCTKGRRLWYRLLRPLASVVDVTGAGDALLAGTARAFAGGWPLEEAVVAGLLCAHLTLFVDGAVAAFLDEGLLQRLARARAAGGTSSRL